MSVIRFTNVGKLYDADRSGAVTALDGLDLAIEPGEYVGILGRSGCGKSTAVGLILGLIQSSTGTVEVLGSDPARAFAALRGRIGCVFQGDRLLPWRTALDNVALPLELAGVDPDERVERAGHWLRALGLGGFEQAFPNQLSGGMRQRVAIARAMVAEPELLIADEAFSALDAVTVRDLRAEFRRIAKEQKQTVVHITHSIDEAIEVSDRILVFGKPGRVVAEFRNDPGARPLRSAILAALEDDAPAAEAAE